MQLFLRPIFSYKRGISGSEKVRIKLTTLRVIVWTLQPLSYWRLYGEQGRNLIITTPVIEDCIRDFLEIRCPPAYNGNYDDMTVKN